MLHRIVEAQKRNDAERCVSCNNTLLLNNPKSSRSSKPGHVRLGYMGHLTLISEDVIGALEHYPPDLRLLLAKHAPQPDWDDYVSGRYHETKVRDTSLLGGGKPVIAPGTQRPVTKWKVDEAEITPSANVPSVQSTNGFEATPVSNDISATTLQGEFRRTSRLSREPSADFGAAPFEHEEATEDSGRPQVRLAYASGYCNLKADYICSLLLILPARCHFTLPRMTARMTKMKMVDGSLIRVLVGSDNLQYQREIISQVGDLLIRDHSM